MYLPEGRKLTTYTVFLSSGDDAQPFRERVRKIVDVLNSQLLVERAEVRFEVDGWDDSAAQKFPTGHPNDMFVHRAESSHLTLVLLLNEIRPGTREEVEAVLALPNAQISVLRFTTATDAANEDLKAFLDAHKNEALFQNVACTGDDVFTSGESWLALFRVLFNMVLSGLRAENGDK